MKKIAIVSISLLLLLSLALAIAVGMAWRWSKQPVSMTAERVDYIVERGAGLRTVVRVMRQEGIDIHEDAFVILARLTGLDTGLQAGAYEAVRGDSPTVLLERMASGDMLQTRLTFVEGWTYQRMREALRNDSNVRQTLDGINDKELIQRLGIQEDSLEGMFYPDTYVFVPGTSDFDILRRAHLAQKELLDTFWQERAADLPLKTPYDALILASIVEKETGHHQDRAKVAGVFINRLRAKMLLQTDPTVIYGMGEAYKGRIRKVDLTTDNPWNTYTRAGLPPTPIANPGKAALLATLQPEAHRYYYFVSRGDGTSEFSQNLAEHNRAVAKYILRRSN